MKRTERLDVRLSKEELRVYQWAAAEDGAEGVSAWVRQLASARARKLRKEAEAR